jgi:hypothetical protein
LFGEVEAPRLQIPRDLPRPGPETEPAPVPAPFHLDNALPTPNLLLEGPAQVGPAESAPAPIMPVLEGWADAASQPSTLTEPLAESPLPLETSTSTAALRAARKAERSRGDLKSLAVILLVIVPLIIYSIIVTIALAILYTRTQAAPPNFFEQIPDAAGDSPGVRQPKTRATLDLSLKTATAKLPDHLLVPLGETLRLGDLEVKPIRVERRKVSTVSMGPGGQPTDPQASPHDALVLVLRLKNHSSRWAFVPLDNYFDRRWKPGKGGSPPLTQLEAGPQRFFGGSADWAPLVPSGGNDRARREWLEGRGNFDLDGLQPGQEMESYVCTDGFDPATAEYLFGVDQDNQLVKPPYRGDFLWRVHLRRGVIDYKGRPKPATAVIGVPFTDRDCRQVG